MALGTSFNYIPKEPKFLLFASKIGFVGVPDTYQGDLSAWRSYWLLAPHSISMLLFGALFVAVCVALGIRPNASGAVLVGASILAEFFHSKWLYRQFLNVEQNNFPFHVVCRTFHLNPRALQSLSKPNDYYPDPRQPDIASTYDPNWQYPRTVHRVDQRLELAIMASVVAGTMLWGYGDLFLTCKHWCGV